MFDMSLIQIKEFKRFLHIEKERQKATQELSEILGIDISLSDEEVMRNAEENFSKAINAKIAKEVNEWMKSVSL
jgi:DNA-binding ferritin-like protein (Dps family)